MFLWSMIFFYLANYGSKEISIAEVIVLYKYVVKLYFGLDDLSLLGELFIYTYLWQAA